LKDLESKGEEYKRNLEVSSINFQQQIISLQEELSQLQVKQKDA
jgi:hypothetical protein